MTKKILLAQAAYGFAGQYLETLILTPIIRLQGRMALKGNSD